MTEHTTPDTLHHKTQQLMQGPLKHIKAAALAAALLPLASVAAKPAEAQNVCASGGVCGTVFDDTNNNGTWDDTEPGIEGVKVFVCQLCDGTDTIDIETGPGGFYALQVPPGATTIEVLIPTGTQPSPPNVGTDDSWDSDGVPDGGGFSVASVPDANGSATDFGFHTLAVEQPGTGTPGYWKNHPDAWPVASITVGGVTYTKAQAISWLTKVGKDKTTTLFSSLVPAMLNLLVGNDGSCVNATISAANQWMAIHHVGSGVAGGSAAWSEGEPLHIILDNYNNGRLCAPHRN
jgi:hypothetical protein